MRIFLSAILFITIFETYEKAWYDTLQLEDFAGRRARDRSQATRYLLFMFSSIPAIDAKRRARKHADPAGRRAELVWWCPPVDHHLVLLSENTDAALCREKHARHVARSGLPCTLILSSRYHTIFVFFVT